MRRPASLLVALALAGTVLPNVLAQWQATTAVAGATRVKAVTLAAGNTPVATVPAASASVTVSWTAASTGAPASGYEVRAYDATSGLARAIVAACTGIVTATTCIETAAPDGTWRYAITPRQQAWYGAESPRSAPVVVDSSYRALVLSDSPVGYWRLGETSGTSAMDERGANNGTYSGGYTLAQSGALAGDANTSVDLNATTGVVTVPHSAALQPTSQLTLEAWVNPDSLAASHYLFNKAYYYYFYTLGGTTYFGIYSAAGAFVFVTTTTLKAGSWQHVVGTFDGTTMRLYRNGVVVAQATPTATIGATTAAVTIGADNATGVNGTDGRLDEAAIYGTALSSAQVLAHYQRGNRTRPELAITFPVTGTSYQSSAWTSGCSATACGIAIDTGGGVAAVTVSVRQGTGNYWNGTSFASATEVLSPATGTTSWSRAFPVANFPADGTYTVRVVGTDSGGGSGTATSTFTIDNVAPTMGTYIPVAAGAYNTAGWNGPCAAQACGLITDAVGGVATTVISLRQGTGNYWNGTAFASATEVMVAAYLVPGFWGYGFTTSFFPTDGAYTLRAFGTDRAGNSASLSTAFTIDRVAVALALTFPANAATYSAGSWNAGCASAICGTASDAGGIAGISVSIRQGTGNYWNGTSFASATDFALSPTGTTSWSLPFAASNFPADGTYTVYAVAADYAGNVSFSSSNTFTISRGPSWSVYVGNSAAASTTVTPITVWTNAAGSAISTGASTQPNAVAITPDGTKAYVANFNAGTVTPITIATNTAGTAITVGNSPRGIAITPDGTKAYVANSGSNTVTPITVSTNTPGTAFAVGTSPQGIAFTPDGTKAYVANSGSNNVTPVTVSTNTPGTAFAVGTTPRHIAITPDGTKAYVANSGSNNVTPITVSTNTAGTAIAMGTGAPYALAITPDGATVWVTNSGTGTIAPITVATGVVGATVTVGTTPQGIAITPDGVTAYVVNNGSNNVTPVALATKVTGTAISVGSGPVGIAITPDQAPVASFVAPSAVHATPTSLNASASTVTFGLVTTYVWDFGDTSTATTTTPTTTHTYAVAGTYTVTLTLTDTAGTSMTRVFTGQTVTRNGGAGARTTRSATVT